MKRKVMSCAAIAILVLAGAATAGASLSPHPASGTPRLASKLSTVRQLKQCGGRMYGVGQFSAIAWNGRAYTRHNAFAFSVGKPYTVRSWNPNVNGEVNSIALNSTCSVAYIGGSFTRVGSTPVRNFAAVSTSTGRVLTGIPHSANSTVDTIARHGKELLVGGYFTSINGQKRTNFASMGLNGRVDGFAHLNLSGNYHYCQASGKCANDPPRIYNQQLSHSGKFDLVEGVFTRVRGTSRQQIAMLNVSAPHATVTGWTSPDFYRHCMPVESFYIRAASWSPDDRTVYIASTGYRYMTSTGRAGGPPMRYLCDAAAALPSLHKSVMPRWINWTGCDSLYATAADSSDAYFGGHERWSHNRYGCDHPGPGHINAPGMEGLSASTGSLNYNPTRARGVGADDMIRTRAGLWIASDNYAGGMCGRQQGHDGICFLPTR